MRYAFAIEMSSRPTIIRFLTLGESHSGKSSLLSNYTQQSFNDTYMPTIGIDFQLKSIQYNDKSYKIQVWDTAGQERFRSITQQYYRGAQGIILVYDVTNADTFRNLKKWLIDIQIYGCDTIKVVLVATKIDQSSERVVSTLEGETFAKSYGIPYFECSAKNGTNVNEAFETLFHAVLENKTTLINSVHSGDNDEPPSTQQTWVGKAISKFQSVVKFS